MQTEHLIVDRKSNVSKILSWNDIDWKTSMFNVTKLRRRIFACKKNGKFKELRNLQTLLLHSKGNILLSIRKVTSSGGKKSPGIDGISSLNPGDKLKLFYEISNMNLKEFRPKATKRIHLLKPDGSPRPIGIPTIKDRVIQNMVKNALEPEWESQFVGYSYGFRPQRTINDAVGRVRSILIPKRRTWVLEVDVAKCFDSISHKYLLEQLKGFPAINLIKSWLEAGILLDEVWLETPTGTPQGGVLSPLLCNIAMHGIGPEIGVVLEKDGRIRSSCPFSIVVYADDMLIFAETKTACNKAITLLDIALEKRGLKLNKTKTCISNAYDGFDFLGFNFRITTRFGRNFRMNIVSDGDKIFEIAPKHWMAPIAQPSKKSITKVKKTLSDLFRKHCFSCESLIISVNRVIRGWSNSKRFWYVWPHFKALDHHLWNLVHRWLKRRYRNKGVKWRNEKHFSMSKNNALGYRDKWTFINPETGRPMLKFYWFFNKNQKDWIQIASAMTPDNGDLETKSYFSERENQLAERGLVDFTGNRDKAIVKRQAFKCPICSDSLFNGETLHRHHIIEKSKGGHDGITNLAILHFTCHTSFHYCKPDIKNAHLIAMTKFASTQMINENLNEPIQFFTEMDSIEYEPITEI